MKSIRSVEDVELRVNNVGGIDETTVTLSPGVTVLAGRNASNRTSLLQAISAGLGSEHASLKSDAEAGDVELEIGEDVYTRTLVRENGTVATGGEPLAEDADSADLFAFLFSWNHARRSVRTGDDLRDVMLRPIDTDRIDAEIDRLEARKARVDDELGDLEGASNALADLRSRRDSLQDRLETKRDELTALRDGLGDGPDEGGDGELEAKLDELERRRSDLEDVEYRLESQRESLDSLREERDDLERQLVDLPEVSKVRIGEIEAEIDTLRERKRSLESTIGRLDGIVQFNEEMLDGEGIELGSDGALTDGLLDDERAVTCWTCGSEVERSAIDDTIERVRELRRDERVERSKVGDRLASLKDELDELTAARDERERIETRIDRVEREVSDREDTVETLAGRADELESAVGRLESTVEELRNAEEGVLDERRRVSELEFEVDRLESELASLDADVAEAKSDVERRAELRENRESLQSSLEDLRTRIDRIEREAVESFNEHMANVLDVLGYGNVDRVWIERTQTERREGRGTVSRPAFDLHVVRSTTDDVAYEDTVDNLSESEREVIGLVFALSGYLAHEVYERNPFVLLDSLEAIDSDRIAALVDYFESYADYLVVALLPEDAAAVDADHRITSI